MMKDKFFIFLFPLSLCPSSFFLSFFSPSHTFLSMRACCCVVVLLCCCIVVLLCCCVYWLCIKNQTIMAGNDILLYGPTMMTMTMRRWTFLAKFWSACILQAWCNTSIWHWKVAWVVWILLGSNGSHHLEPPVHPWQWCQCTNHLGLCDAIRFDAHSTSDLLSLANSHITRGFVGAQWMLFASTRTNVICKYKLPSSAPRWWVKQKDSIWQSTTQWLMFLDFFKSGMQSICEALLSKRYLTIFCFLNFSSVMATYVHQDFFFTVPRKAIRYNTNMPIWEW